MSDKEINDDIMNSAEAQVESGAVAAAHQAEDATPQVAPSEPAKHAKHAQDLPEYEKTANTLRKKLIAAIVVLVVLALVLAALIVAFLLNAQNVAVQQTPPESEVSQISGSESNETADDQKSATVPALALTLGQSYDDAVAEIGHGAQVSSDESKEDDDIGDDGIKRTVRLTLANDASDTKSGNPTVTLRLDKDDVVKSVSYQASTKVLGYGTMSFQDAVLNDKIITRVMSEAGVSINEDDVTLPENSSEYSTYTSDGQRISKEERTFSGQAQNCSWSATLLYDYALSLTTDNLADTVRTISITVS